MELQGLIDVIVGASKHEAFMILDDSNIDYRVVRDGKTMYGVTTDLDVNRLNLEIDKKIVTKCYIG